MTFFEKIKRFFEPLEWQSILVFFSITKYSLWALYALYSVHIVRESVKLFDAKNFEGLHNLIVEFIFFTCIYFLFSFFFRKVDWPILWHEIQRWIYQRYLEKIFVMDGNTLEKIGTWRIIATISSWEKVWIDGILHVIQEGTKILIVSGYILYLFFSQSFLAWAWFIIAFIILHALVIYVDMYARKNRKDRTERKTDLTRWLVRIVMSRNEILQSGKVEWDIRSTMNIIDQIELANNGINKALFIIFNLVRLTASIFRLATLFFLIYASTHWTMSTADVAGIFALLIVFESFLFNSTEFYKNFTKDFSDIEKLWKMFDDAPKMQWYDVGKTFSPKNKNIEIQNISYGYDETRVFEDFSLSFESGKKTALVGASGGGKTTLMKLIAGYLHPQSGYISVLGNKLDETALKTYYPHIGYLTQDPSVFDATIRENLISAMIQKPDINIEKQLIKALKLAHCDFVFELEKWLDTEIGERWVRLSWGQKQRLAIAKIFLKDPEIILLDEPTSALDSFSEEAITVALDELFIGRTVIIVAHRLQTVRKADEIIVLEWGKIVERGDHNSLVKEWWIYARMLELQSGF